MLSRAVPRMLKHICKDPDSSNDQSTSSRMPKSRGPPYADPPPATYIVVIRPWSVEAPPKRTQRDYDRVGTWIAYILWDAAGRGRSIPNIESIYRMKTRDETIIQLPLGTDISPLLGEHHWPSFVKGWKHNGGAGQSTLVFLYNWKNNGDPANHNWEEFFPNVLSLSSVPIKSPYPRPSWARLPSTLTSLALPIPKEHIEAGVEQLQELERELLGKCDPYELEEGAKDLLSSFKPELEEDIKLDIIKNENEVPGTEAAFSHVFADRDYQPSAELLDAFSTLSQSMQLPASDCPTSAPRDVKVETPTEILHGIKATGNMVPKRELSQENIVVGKKRIKVEES
ncbi:hypothetical protein EDD15DRAFT_2382230 [Pisolithus albus]|nr:hypothetical protein EDD15DRAFT_2382230 [Pisolithus albus]